MGCWLLRKLQSCWISWVSILLSTEIDLSSLWAISRSLRTERLKALLICVMQNVNTLLEILIKLLFAHTLEIMWVISSSLHRQWTKLINRHLISKLLSWMSCRQGLNSWVGWRSFTGELKACHPLRTWKAHLCICSEGNYKAVPLTLILTQLTIFFLKKYFIRVISPFIKWWP